MIVGQGMKMAAGGNPLGIAAAMAVAPSVAGLLYGVDAVGPATIAVAFPLGETVVLAACSIPALCVSKIDPTNALRYE